MDPNQSTPTPHIDCPTRRGAQSGNARVGLLVAIALAAAFVALTPGAERQASATSNGPCPTSAGVTVVVDFQELGGTVVRCTDNAPRNGFDALRLAGFTWSEPAASPGFICRIDGTPANDPCINVPPATAYWSYWVGARGGIWCYSPLGAAGRTPPEGSVDGWSFALNKRPGAIPAPRRGPFGPVNGAPSWLAAERCGSSTAAPTTSLPDTPVTTRPATTTPTTRPTATQPPATNQQPGAPAGSSGGQPAGGSPSDVGAAAANGSGTVDAGSGGTTDGAAGDGTTSGGADGTSADGGTGATSADGTDSATDKTTDADDESADDKGAQSSDDAAEDGSGDGDSAAGADLELQRAGSDDGDGGSSVGTLAATIVGVGLIAGFVFLTIRRRRMLQ